MYDRYIEMEIDKQNIINISDHNLIDVRLENQGETRKKVWKGENKGKLLLCNR